MKGEKGEATPEGGPGELARAPESYSENGPKRQGPAPLWMIGHPRVLVEHRNGSAFVKMENRPWGWLDPSKEFLNPRGSGLKRYIADLEARIAKAAWDEASRRERLNEAKRRERAELRRQAEGKR